MKCPKCGNGVSSYADYCPNCKMNLSFTTKNKSEYMKTEEAVVTFDNVERKVNKIKGIIVLVIAITMIILIAFLCFFDLFTIIKGIFVIKKYSKFILILGALLLLIGFVLFLKKKKGTFVKILFITSLVLIVSILTLDNVINIEGDNLTFLKDYSKVDYIEIGSEKIPSLCFVVGYREILFNVAENDVYDEGMKTKIDYISIVYKNISDEDKNLYISKLIDAGFSLKIVTDDEGITHNFYAKDKKDDTFYVIVISNSEINYSKGKGSFDDIINNM